MTNIFLIHTEYHLMLTLRIIVSCYNNDKNFVFYTVGRIKEDNLVNSNTYGITYQPIPRYNYGNKSTVDAMMATDSQNFFVFQDHVSDNIFLIYHLHRKKVKVALVQDGYKPYPVWHRKRLPLVIIKETFELYKQMWKRRAMIPSLVFRSYKYGKLRFVEELWLEYPDKLPYKTSKKIIQIPDFTDESLRLVLTTFSFLPDSIYNDTIFYVGQPLKKESFKKKELEIIKQLIQKYPNNRFVFRPHPNMSKEQLSCIIQIDGVAVYDTPIPIELLLITMKNSIIISPWSTALLTNNKQCRFYWIYKILGRGSLEKIQIEIVNPTSHINVIENLDEIL